MHWRSKCPELRPRSTYHGHPCGKPDQLDVASADAADAARPVRAAAPLPRPHVLGRQGAGRPQLLPLPRRGIRDPVHARRPRPAWKTSRSSSSTQFTPQKITYHDLLQFVGMLHRSGLVISEATGQGHQLRKRRDEKKWRELMGKLANVFALRFRGVDPERFFNWIYPYTGWFFRWYTVVCRDAARPGRPDAGRRATSTSSAAGCRRFTSSSVRRTGSTSAITMARGQGAARVRPRPVVQAFRRRMPRAGGDAAGLHARPVLQRLRLLDAAQQVAPGGDRRGGHVRRAVPGLDRHVPVVVQHAGPAQLRSA